MSSPDRTESQPQNIDEHLDDLLRRVPAGPDFTQSTLGYCDQAVEAAMAKMGGVLVRQYPQLSDQILLRLKSVSNPRTLSESDFLLDNDQVRLRTPSGKSINTLNVLKAVYNADPALGIFNYAIALYPPRNPSEARFKRYPWFTGRLNKIAELGDYQLDDPIIEIIAVAYITQVAKNLAVDRSKQMLKRVAMFGGISSEDKVMPYLDSIEGVIGPIRTNEAYINRGITTINSLAEKEGYSEPQVQFLLDLAFLRNKAFDESKEFRQVFDPLIKLISTGRWEEAYEHRDFLLKYFASSFPEWKVRQFQEETGVKSFESIKLLAKAVVSGDVNIADEDVPSEFRESFGITFPKKVERAQHNRDAEIIKHSVNLSNTILREMDRETRIMIFHGSLETYLGDSADTALAIFANPQGKADFDRLLEVVESVDPDMSYKNAEALYLRWKNQSATAFRETFKAPYHLRLPDQIEILEVELRGNNQVYWYPIGSLKEFMDQKGNLVLLQRDYADFAILLNRFIHAGGQQMPGRPTLSYEALQRAMNRAYKEGVNSNLHGIQFTLSEYLNALIHTLRPQPDADDPIWQFIEMTKIISTI